MSFSMLFNVVHIGYLTTTGSVFDVHALDPLGQENQQDILRYVRFNIEKFVESTELEKVVELILAKCEGIFLSARLMLHEHGLQDFLRYNSK
jgi:uncharacterized protein YdhG (YjbR/CyaY superfamily)